MAEDGAFPASLELRCGPVSALDLALFAAASGDHNPLHLDDAIARDAGFARPVVHGMFTMALQSRLLVETFGATALRSLQTRFTGAALRGEVLVLSASLKEADDEEATYALLARTEDGREILTGSARVRR